MRARTAPLLVALAAAFLLAGCGGTSSSDLPADVGDGVTSDMMVEGEAPAISGEMVAGDKAVGAPTTITTDRQVVRTGYVAMRVADVAKSTFDVHALVRKRNGLISNEDAQSSGGSTYANITAQIPAAELDAFIADVTALGTVDSISVTAADVTTQVVDLDARIKALQASIDRMTQLMAQATRIEDLLSIEAQLSQRQAELDSLKAQRTYLGDQVAMSTITVSISPETQITDVDAPGFLSGLQSGWAAFVSLITVAVTAIGFFLPFLLVLVLVAIPVAIIVIRQARRHRVVPAAPAQQKAPSEPTT